VSYIVTPDIQKFKLAVSRCKTMLDSQLLNPEISTVVASILSYAERFNRLTTKQEDAVGNIYNHWYYLKCEDIGEYQDEDTAIMYIPK